MTRRSVPGARKRTVCAALLLGGSLVTLAACAAFPQPQATGRTAAADGPAWSVQ